MKPIDTIGNKLYKGDLVRVKIPDGAVIGEIAEIEAPGTVLQTADMSARQMPQSPGKIRITLDLSLSYYNGRMPIDGVLKVYNPGKAVLEGTNPDQGASGSAPDA